MRHLPHRPRRGTPPPGDPTHRSGGTRRWLDRRTLVALVAATAVVTTAIYATGTHDDAPITARQAADTSQGSAGPDRLTLPFTLTDLRHNVDLYTPSTGLTGPTVALQTTSQLLGTYHIDLDANQLQPFLDRSATATTSQQLTDDAHTFLVQQGVPRATIDQAMTDIATLQNQSSIVVGQGQGQGGIDWKKIAVAIALILAAALVAFLAFGAVGAAARSAAADSKVDCRGGATGPWTGPPINTEAGLNAAYRVLPTRHPMPNPGDSGITATSGLGIDSANDQYVFSPPGVGRYTFDSSTGDQDLVDATNARLQLKGINVSSSSVHAEQKMATYMRVCHVDAVDFVINNNYVCYLAPNSCDQVLPVLLGTGQRLAVHFLTANFVNPNQPAPGTGTWITNPYVGI
jgi:hypothetical protein